MAKVTFIEFGGKAHQVEIPNGDTVMQGAMDNGIDGIVAECGGGLACATCICTVDENWIGFLDPKSDAEEQMLAFIDDESVKARRLSCQITINEKLDGLVVTLPQNQY